MKEQKQRMIAGKLYLMDDQLKNDIYKTRADLLEFNKLTTRPEIQAKAREIFGSFGENSSVTPPFRCDYGYNIYIGNNVYFNYNTSITDVVPVYIGDNCLIGPDCGFYPAEHPIDPELRKTGIEYGKPITLEENVWLGGKVTVLGEVRIGKNSIIGAGSVVSKDISANVVAAGNPCRVIREIGDGDKVEWEDKYSVFLDEINY